MKKTIEGLNITGDKIREYQRTLQIVALQGENTSKLHDKHRATSTGELDFVIRRRNVYIRRFFKELSIHNKIYKEVIRKLPEELTRDFSFKSYLANLTRYILITIHPRYDIDIGFTVELRYMNKHKAYTFWEGSRYEDYCDMVEELVMDITTWWEDKE